MNRQRNGAKIPGHEHHDLMKLLALFAGKGCQIVRMALVPEAGGVERFLLNGIGDKSRGFTGHHERHALVDGSDYALCRRRINNARLWMNPKGPVQDRQG